MRGGGKSNKENCEHDNLRKMVPITVDTPVDVHGITKKEIKRKDVSIVSANWSRMTIYCADCGQVMHRHQEQSLADKITRFQKDYSFSPSDWVLVGQDAIDELNEICDMAKEIKNGQ